MAKVDCNQEIYNAETQLLILYFHVFANLVSYLSFFYKEIPPDITLDSCKIWAELCEQLKLSKVVCCSIWDLKTKQILSYGLFFPLTIYA